jgi:hypothetical protein
MKAVLAKLSLDDSPKNSPESSGSVTGSMTSSSAADTIGQDWEGGRQPPWAEPSWTVQQSNQDVHQNGPEKDHMNSMAQNTNMWDLGSGYQDNR